MTIKTKDQAVAFFEDPTALMDEPLSTDEAKLVEDVIRDSEDSTKLAVFCERLLDAKNPVVFAPLMFLAVDEGKRVDDDKVSFIDRMKRFTDILIDYQWATIKATKEELEEALEASKGLAFTKSAEGMIHATYDFRF